MERPNGGHTGDLDFPFCSEMVGGQVDGQRDQGGVESSRGGGDRVKVSPVG